MTLRVKKRGKTYRLEGRAGQRARRGSGERERLRLSLGTMNSDAAYLLYGKIERALAEGPDSSLWRELRRVLPADTFEKLAAIAGHMAEEISETPKHSWQDLASKFSAWTRQRVALGKMRESTSARYEHASAAFGEFLASAGIIELDEITRAVVEDFKAWRLTRVLAKKNSRGGRGVVLDSAILHRIFSYATECELVTRNPVRLEGRPGDDRERGAQPFTGDELARLRHAAGPDLLAFLLLRHTGLRGFDATDLRWAEIDHSDRMLSRRTQKRGKQVWIPLHPELFFAIEAEFTRRQPRPEDRVLLNPETGKPMTRPRLYERMRALGRRTGVANAHPHRFRDTLAVDMLLKGASAYDVAKTLGDTVAVVEEHYAPYVRELRERTRKIMESSEGLEQVTGTPRAQEKAEREKIN